jgi:hypothetical protein
MRKTEKINGKRFKCYDNETKLDRYTVVYLDEPEHRPNTYSGRGMSENPCSPSGFGCSVIVTPGRHLGKRISFNDLPPPVQQLITSDLTFNGGNQ